MRPKVLASPRICQGWGTYTLLFWNDTVCIDQEDLEERSEQVRRMASIYKMAYRVIAWLGPESADSKLALSTIAKLGSQVECSDDLSSYFKIRGCNDPGFAAEDFPLSLTEQQWESLDNFISWPWFPRLWIIQEIRLANHLAIIQCGREQIEWSHPGRAFLSTRDNEEQRWKWG